MEYDINGGGRSQNERTVKNNKKKHLQVMSLCRTLYVFVLFCFFLLRVTHHPSSLSSNELTSFNSSGKPMRLVFVGSYFKNATCRICLGPWKLIFLCPLSHTSLCKLPAEYHPLPWRCVGNSPFVAWWKWAESLNKSEHS